MKEYLLRRPFLPTSGNNAGLLLGFGAFTILSILVGMATEWYFLVGLPLVLLLAFVTLLDYRKVFYLLLICIPISTEILLPNGLGTDLPTEPLILGLMGIFVLKLLHEPTTIELKFFKHPITLLLLLHFGWSIITAVTSCQFVFSAKFVLAKFWYILVFYFMAGRLLKNPKEIRIAFWCLLLPLLLTMLVINIRHAANGFSFESIYSVLNPFYRNHVMYACIMVAIFPFIWYAIRWYWSSSWTRNFLICALFFFLLAIYFSYTRAAYIALVVAAVVYVVIRLRWMKFAVLAGLLGGILGVAYLVQNNNYLDYAPNYERTITHTEFDDLLVATYNFEDISTMERVHRWVGGFFMVQEKPWLGFGPGNFYSFYQPYTLTSFRTYVSDNPEQSGVHNYYLMLAVEQGILGLLIFLLLCTFALLKAEQIYHNNTHSSLRFYMLPTAMSFAAIIVLLLINDLIETDKIGSIFFMLLAFLVNLDSGTTTGQKDLLLDD